jgi:hypothetical protein
MNPGRRRRRPRVKELVRYLFENLYFDIRGDISVEQVREFLREDDTREARQLLGKIIEENGVDDLLITLADCLKEHIRTGVSEQIIREQLGTYSDS